MFEPKLEAFISENDIREVTIGAEMEVYVIDHVEDPPILLQSESVIKDIYSAFDERVYKDYYNYQLEIRTNPSDDPYEVSNELCELLREVSKVAREYDCYIAPVSYIENEDENAVYCGFHIHISLKNNKNTTKELIKMILSMYPVIYDIARISLSSPDKDPVLGDILSKRIANSRHIGLPDPPLDLYTLKITFINHRQRYFDIALNLNTREEDRSERHRIKDVTTIEIRVFDTIGSKKAIETVVEAVYNLAKRVKTDWIKEVMESPKKSIIFLETINCIRLNVISSRLYFNPFLLTYADETLEYLDVSSALKDAWIKYEFVDWWLVTTPQFHKYYCYPI